MTIQDEVRSLGSRNGPLSDAAAFSDFVHSQLPGLVRLAARISPNTAPDDVVQEALIRAWRYRGSYNARLGAVSTWLMTIVANEARRAHRRPVPLPVRPANARSPVEDRLDVEAAVKRLPPRQRLAVDCFYYADLSISETASVMGCSEGTVKSTLADARERLRGILMEDR